MAEEKEQPKKEQVEEPKKEKAEKAGKPAKEGKSDKKDSTAEDKAAAKKAKKSKRRSIPEGVVCIHASYNNTIVTIAEPNGNVIAWGSSGSSGFKGTRKSTPYAAQVAAELTADKAKVFGLEKVHIYVKGPGPGREQAIRGLVSKGLDVISINDITPIPHNGCRKKKGRRV